MCCVDFQLCRGLAEAPVDAQYCCWRARSSSFNRYKSSSSRDGLCRWTSRRRALAVEDISWICPFIFGHKRIARSDCSIGLSDAVPDIGSTRYQYAYVRRE